MSKRISRRESQELCWRTGRKRFGEDVLEDVGGYVGERVGVGFGEDVEERPEERFRAGVKSSVE